MRFYLGTHETSWLGRLDVPLFVSARRLRLRKRMPRAAGRWALDSGGFTELDLHGRWQIPAKQYADEVMRWSEEIGGLDWAAPQDWMCEPTIREKTGLKVEEHQIRTVSSVQELRMLGASVIAVVQGWTIGDYVRCVELYDKAGIDLRSEPTVGVGTVCRRQSTAEGVAIVRTLASMGIRLHGFGIKSQGLAVVGHMLASSDSLAWSDAARRRPIRLDGCPHKTCANCRKWALQWREDVVSKISMPPPQLDLWGTP